MRADPVAQRVMVLRCPELSRPGDDPPDRDAARGREAARLAERVIAAVTGFCPGIEVVEPGVCAFGARGPARYFGGETALAVKIIAAVAELGVESCIGIADGLFAALLASRPVSPGPVLRIPPGETAGFLAAQPVSVLDNQDLAGLLKRLGLDTLGDFAALPGGDVASRFGDAGAAAHRLARGLDPRPLAVRPPAEDLSASLEFRSAGTAVRARGVRG
jgi:protein ImuB